MPSIADLRRNSIAHSNYAFPKTPKPFYEDVFL